MKQNNKKLEKQTTDFIQALNKLDIIDIFGVAKILNVDFKFVGINSDKENFDEEISEFIFSLADCFIKLDESGKKELMKLLKNLKR